MFRVCWAVSPLSTHEKQTLIYLTYDFITHEIPTHLSFTVTTGLNFIKNYDAVQQYFYLKFYEFQSPRYEYFHFYS